jgi:ketosteroid isomerase-like protein
MRNFHRLAWLSFFLLFGGPCLAADSQAEIRQLLNYFADLWNEGDLDGLRSYFHKDFVLVSASETHSREQRMDELGVIMAPGKDHGELGFSEVQVVPLDDNHALAYGRSRLKFSDGTELGSMFTTVYARTPFGWKAILTHD